MELVMGLVCVNLCLRMTFGMGVPKRFLRLKALNRTATVLLKKERAQDHNQFRKVEFPNRSKQATIPGHPYPAPAVQYVKPPGSSICILSSLIKGYYIRQCCNVFASTDYMRFVKLKDDMVMPPYVETSAASGSQRLRVVRCLILLLIELNLAIKQYCLQCA